MPSRLLTLLLACSVGTALADGTVKVGDLEMHCVAVPTQELTPEAAKGFNVRAEPGRGLLTVTVLRKSNPGKAVTLAAQVYAGAINQNNELYTIPIREVREGDSVYYLGEFRLSAPDTMRFLVNANVLGKPLRTEFARTFHIQ